MMRQQAEERKAQNARERERDVRLLTEVFDEIISTEATYLEDLRFVTTRFLTPMTDLLSPQQHHAIFSNIRTLLQLHEKLRAGARGGRQLSHQRGADLGHWMRGCQPWRGENA